MSTAIAEPVKRATTTLEHPILFFDGLCGLCNWSVDFVMKRDRVEYRDALRILSERAVMEMPRYGGGDSREKASERHQLLEAHSAA